MIDEYNRRKSLEAIQAHYKALEELGLVLDNTTIQLDESAYIDYFGHVCHEKHNLGGRVRYREDGVDYSAFVGPDIVKYKVIEKGPSH